MYKINTVSFENLSIYVSHNDDLKEVYRFKEKMNKNIEIPILLNAGEAKEYYLQVDFTKSIYFPLEIVTEVENRKANLNKQLQLGLLFVFFTQK